MKKSIALAALLIACTDEAGTRRTLEAEGFTDIVVGDFAPWSCGKDDDFATQFTAKNARGKTVHGAVCCGVFKNCTVRF